MKKLISFILSMIIMVISTTPVFATDKTINDFDWSAAEKIDSRNEMLGGEFYIVDTYETIEEIVSLQRNYGVNSERNYKKTICEVWNVYDEYAVNASDSENNDDWDSTGAVHFFITIYYTDITSGGIDYRKMNSVSGRYAVMDSQVTVSTHAAVAFQRGAPLNTGEPTYTDQIYYYPSSQSWSWVLPSASFPYLQKGTEITYQAVRYEYTLKRGTGSTWSESFVTTV